MELEEVGDYQRADRIRKCGCRVAQWRRISRCKIRGWCPSCGAHLAEQYGRAVTAAIRRMTAPQVFLVTVPVYAVEDLRDGIERLQASLKTLRQRKLLATGTRGGVLCIETKEGDRAGNAAWNVHAHMVLDVVDFDVRAAHAAWAALAGGRFLKDEHGTVLDPIRFGRYATKSDTWAPVPGVMPVSKLRILAAALHGVQMVASWGSARRPQLLRSGDRSGAVEESSGPLFDWARVHPGGQVFDAALERALDALFVKADGSIPHGSPCASRRVHPGGQVFDAAVEAALDALFAEVSNAPS